MKIIVTISDIDNCIEQYLHTGDLPQKKIRTVEVEIPDISLNKGEAIDSINIKLENETT